MVLLETKFNAYYTSFETNMTKAGSAYADALASIEQQFAEYGIPVEERAKYLVQAQLTALQTITTSAVQATLGVIEEEKKQDATDSQIAVDTSQIELNTKQGLKLDKDTSLVTEQINTQTQATTKTQNEALKVVQETLKVVRDKQGYDDQMIMKTTEQQANLASFAVNANSTTAQSAINNLKCLMLKQLSRTVPLAGESACSLNG